MIIYTSETKLILFFFTLLNLCDCAIWKRRGILKFTFECGPSISSDKQETNKIVGIPFVNVT